MAAGGSSTGGAGHQWQQRQSTPAQQAAGGRQAAGSRGTGSTGQLGQQGQSATVQKEAGGRPAAKQAAAPQADRDWEQPAEGALTPQNVREIICTPPERPRPSETDQELAPEVSSSDATAEEGSTAIPTSCPTIISFDPTYDSAGRASLPTAAQLNPRRGGPPAIQQQREESSRGQLAAAAAKAGDDAAASIELPVEMRAQVASPPRQELCLLLLTDAAC